MKLYRMAASNISWGTSNFDCVEALTSLKHRLCWRETFPEEPQTLTVSKHRTYWSIKYAGKQHFLRNLKLWLCRSFDLAQISIVQASNIPWETSKLDCVEELTSLKHQVCRWATFPEDPQALTVLKHWPNWNIKSTGVRHSLRNLKPWLCLSIDLAGTSSVPASDIPCEPQTLTLSKHRPIWNIMCASEWHSLRNLNLWLCQSIDLTEASSVPARDILWGTSNFDYVKALTTLKHQVCPRATFPEEPQSLTVSKHWSR